MFGRNLQRQAPNRPIATQLINGIIDAVERLQRMRVGSGLALTEVAGTPYLRLDPSTPLILHAVSGASGIGIATSTSQMTSGTVTLRDSPSDGSLSTSTSTITAWSKDTVSAVGNYKELLLCWDGNKYVVFWEQC